MWRARSHDGLVRELDARGAAFCSARLSSDDLPALQALEVAGFRFQEHTLAPWRTLDDWDSKGFAVTRPTEEPDLPRLCDIARRAFRTDRFHRDPRLRSSGRRRALREVGQDVAQPAGSPAGTVAC